MLFNLAIVVPLLLASGAVAQNRQLLPRGSNAALEARSVAGEFNTLINAREAEPSHDHWEDIMARGIPQSKPKPAPAPAPYHPKLKWCNIMTCHQMCAEGQTRCNSVHNHKGATGLCVEVPGQQT